MVHPAVGFLGGVIVLAYGVTATAAPWGGPKVELDFTKPDVAQQASATQGASLKLRPDGLTCEAPRYTMLPFQLQTIEPIAIGVYMWPYYIHDKPAICRMVAGPASSIRPSSNVVLSE